MGDELWIKRVIAVGGDRVEIKNGYVFINGERKDEPYIDNKPITFLRDKDSLDITLKEDEIFYLGDNRTVSEDARMHGPCKVDDVVGVVENWSLWLNDLFD
jgi:signal peptidase I